MLAPIYKHYIMCVIKLGLKDHFVNIIKLQLQVLGLISRKDDAKFSTDRSIYLLNERSPSIKLIQHSSTSLHVLLLAFVRSILWIVYHADKMHCACHEVNLRKIDQLHDPI